MAVAMGLERRARDRIVTDSAAMSLITVRPGHQRAAMKPDTTRSIGPISALSWRNAEMSPPRSAGIFEPFSLTISTFRLPLRPMK